MFVEVSVCVCVCLISMISLPVTLHWTSLLTTTTSLLLHYHHHYHNSLSFCKAHTCFTETVSPVQTHWFQKDANHVVITYTFFFAFIFCYILHIYRFLTVGRMLLFYIFHFLLVLLLMLLLTHPLNTFFFSFYTLRTTNIVRNDLKKKSKSQPAFSIKLSRLRVRATSEWISFRKKQKTKLTITQPYTSKSVKNCIQTWREDV